MRCKSVFLIHETYMNIHICYKYETNIYLTFPKRCGHGLINMFTQGGGEERIGRGDRLF